MSSLPVAARVYVGAVMTVAGALLGLRGQLPRVDELPPALALVLAPSLTSTLRLRLPPRKTRARMGVSLIIDFAALLLIGPNKAVLIAAVGAVSQSTLRVTQRNPPHRIL